MTLSATAEAVGTTAAPLQRRTRAQQACEARAAYCSCGCSPATSRGKPMVIEAHRVVQQVVDGLRATRSTIGQRLVAKGWSANLTTQHTWAAEWSRSSTATAALSCFRSHREVEPAALPLVAHCTRCRQWPRGRSAHAHDLPKVGALADGRVSTISFSGFSGFSTVGPPRRRPKFVSEIVRKRVNKITHLQNNSPSKCYPIRCLIDPRTPASFRRPASFGRTVPTLSGSSLS